MNSLRWWLVCGFSAAVLGCGSSPQMPTPNQKAAPDDKATAKKTEPDKAAPHPAPNPAKAASEEAWYASYLGEAKLGYLRLARRTIAERGRELSEWTFDTQFAIQRSGQTSEVRIRFISHETLDGKLLSFEGEQPFGPARQLVRGEVMGRELQIETSGSNRLDRSRIPWREGVGGFHAIEQSLAAKPLQPGETRKLDKLEPIVFQVVPVVLTAGQLESTRLLDGAQELLRIEALTTLPGGVEQRQTVWCDSEGQIQKIYSPAERTTTFRCSHAEAIAAGTGARIDLLFDAQVLLAGPLPGGHTAPQLQYKVHVPDSDPSQVFATGGTQHVEKLDDHTARITVCRLLPGEEPPAGFGAKSPPPDKAFLAGSAFLQIEDPLIQELARSVAADETDPWKTAIALEKLVHEKMKVDFSHAFATAADVAKSLHGDCTEYSVLLAALCRSRGIPARVAIGLVYLGDKQPAFGFHMWNEVYIDGRWIPIDATLGRGGIGAAHIKVADTTLSEGASLVSLLPVAQLLGRLKIEVEGAEPSK